MNTVFFDKSKEIADNFLQSIAFLDDKAFGNNAVENIEHNNNQHAFDSFEISKAFAKRTLAVFLPTPESDISSFLVLGT